MTEAGGDEPPPGDGTEPEIEAASWEPGTRGLPGPAFSRAEPPTDPPAASPPGPSFSWQAPPAAPPAASPPGPSFSWEAPLPAGQQGRGPAPDLRESWLRRRWRQLTSRLPGQT